MENTGSFSYSEAKDNLFLLKPDAHAVRGPFFTLKEAYIFNLLTRDDIAAIAALVPRQEIPEKLYSIGYAIRDKETDRLLLRDLPYT